VRLRKSQRHPAWQKNKIAYVRRPYRSLSEMFLTREAERLLAEREAEGTA